MKLPVRIESDKGGNPILSGGYYFVVDAANNTVATFPLASPGGCLGTVHDVRRFVRLINAEGGIKQALDGMVELGTGLLNDLGGCDHAVNICQCADKALVDQAKEVAFRLNAPSWPGEQRHAELFEDIRDILRDLIDGHDNTGDQVVQEPIDRAKQLLAELERGV